MALEQRWEVHTRAGNNFTLVTLIGLGPVQALAQAGLTMSDVVSIIPGLPVAPA